MGKKGQSRAGFESGPNCWVKIKTSMPVYLIDLKGVFPVVQTGTRNQAGWHDLCT
jgi:hypothetical protein